MLTLFLIIFVLILLGCAEQVKELAICLFQLVAVLSCVVVPVAALYAFVMYASKH